MPEQPNSSGASRQGSQPWIEVEHGDVQRTSPTVPNLPNGRYVPLALLEEEREAREDEGFRFDILVTANRVAKQQRARAEKAEAALLEARAVIADAVDYIEKPEGEARHRHIEILKRLRSSLGSPEGRTE